MTQSHADTSPAGWALPIRRLIYEIHAEKPLLLHMDVPTVTIRGALGFALLRILGHSPDLLPGEERVKIFQAAFAPKNNPDSPQAAFGADPPRPFVMRGGFKSHDQKTFHLELLLFGWAGDAAQLFSNALANAAIGGIGADSKPCQIQMLADEPVIPSFPPDVFQVDIDFLTPTRIRTEQAWCEDDIPFHALFSRLADRIDSLLMTVGTGATAIPPKRLADLKRRSRSMVSHKLSGGRYNSRRVSSRTGDDIRLDGFVGQMSYSGGLDLYAPYLAYLPWLHVGKSAAFGCGWPVATCHSLG